MVAHVLGALGALALVWGFRQRRGGALLGPPPGGEHAETTLPLVVACAAFLPAGIVVAAALQPLGPSRAMQVLANQCVYLVFALVLLRYARSGERTPTQRGPRLAGLGVVGGVAAFSVALYVGLTLIATYGAFGAAPPQQPVVEWTTQASGFERLTLILTAAVIAPFAEEVFYRGILFPALARRMPIAAALVLQGALFAFLHFWQQPALWPLAIPLAGVGMMFGIVYHRTASLGAAVLAHATFNAIQLSMLPWE